MDLWNESIVVATTRRVKQSRISARQGPESYSRVVTCCGDKMKVTSEVWRNEISQRSACRAQIREPHPSPRPHSQEEFPIFPKHPPRRSPSRIAHFDHGFQLEALVVREDRAPT